MTFSLSVITLFIGALGLVLAGFSLWQIRSLNRLRQTFFAGTKALDLESVIQGLKQELKDSQQHQRILEQALTELKKNLTFSVQKVGLVRFNPFKDGGANFSFALALLDWHNTGVVITSMYGREQNRIYTKKIDQGKSEGQLTAEEQEAMLTANKKSSIK